MFLQFFTLSRQIFVVIPSGERFSLQKGLYRLEFSANNGLTTQFNLKTRIGAEI